ncbi:MAG TPA: FtsH protease activity modulator HflK [Roseomonas sp.]
MPWNNGGGQSPWGNRPQGPWGAPPPPGGGNQGGRGPDMDDVIRQAQEAVRRFMPRRGGGKGIGLLAILLIAGWGVTGFYRVEPDEVGVVTRFGAYTGQLAPSGLNYHLPWPIESAATPRVTTENQIFIGFRSGDPVASGRAASARDVVEESMMLTGDENIIDIDFVVRWRIRDAGEFLFDTRNPESTIKSAAESVMREVIGRTPIQPALTEARGQIAEAVRTGTQAILDQYRAGVIVTSVELQKVDPPAAVIDAFRDVQRASADRDRQRNEAEAYRNDIIPRARGEAERMIQEATGFRDSQTARARGEAGRFSAVLAAYQMARDVTVRRMYIETMEEILRRNPTIIIDDRLQGLVPFLQLGGADGARAPGPRQAEPGTRPPPLPPSPSGYSTTPSRATGAPR